MVGLVTLVMSLVDSVISTSFLVSGRDIWTFSGPMLSVSSGTLPGQSSTTTGLSAPIAGQSRHKHVIRETVGARGFMVAPFFQPARDARAGNCVFRRFFDQSLRIARPVVS